MKTINLYLLNFALLFGVGTTAVFAQGSTDDKKIIIPEGTTVFVLNGKGNVDDTIKYNAYNYFYKTLRVGPQQVGMPRFLITDKNNKAVFTIGGFVNARVAYDFNNVIDNLDFVTYNIPMSSNIANSQRFLMDASTSRIYFKTLVNTKSLGSIEAYIETDFRGTNYALRLREAYISFKGFTFGQTVTTFCDLSASPNTIDFEGPNAYTYGRNLMIQYKHAFNEHWSVALAAEYPVLSATYNSTTEAIPQRIPDIPLYVQYAWNKGQSHIRASGIIRSLYYGNRVDNQVEYATGWGAQLSGIFKISNVVTAYGQALYGAGITPYIQDIAGMGMDLNPNPMLQGELQAPQTSAWLLGAQFNITPQLPLSIGYSQVHVIHKDDYSVPTDYKLAQYVVANVFYNISRSFSVGAEYLYGTRYNQDGTFGRSNRVQAMIQFNF